MERLRAFKQPSENLPHLDHLENGQEPIFCTVEDRERLSRETIEYGFRKTGETNYTFLNYEAPTKQLREGNVLVESDQNARYLISPIDATWKISQEYFNCQGLVVSGMTHEGTRVGFMTHHNPHLLGSKSLASSFFADLEGQLTALRSQTKEGTIDAVIFGGDAFTTAPRSKKAIDPTLDNADEYRIAAETVAQTTEKILGFTPRITEGPRILPHHEGMQTAVFDTEHNHLHIIVTGASKNSGSEITIEEVPQMLEELREMELEQNKRKGVKPGKIIN